VGKGTLVVLVRPELAAAMVMVVCQVPWYSLRLQGLLCGLGCSCSWQQRRQVWQQAQQQQQQQQNLAEVHVSLSRMLQLYTGRWRTAAAAAAAAATQRRPDRAWLLPRAVETCWRRACQWVDPCWRISG
jgi:hypothetical protein